MTAADLAARGNSVHAERCKGGWVTERTLGITVRTACPLCDEGQAIAAARTATSRRGA